MILTAAALTQQSSFIFFSPPSLCLFLSPAAVFIAPPSLCLALCLSLSVRRLSPARLPARRSAGRCPCFARSARPPAHPSIPSFLSDFLPCHASLSLPLHAFRIRSDCALTRCPATITLHCTPITPQRNGHSARCTIHPSPFPTVHSPHPPIHSLLLASLPHPAALCFSSSLFPFLFAFFLSLLDALNSCASSCAPSTVFAHRHVPCRPHCPCRFSRLVLHILYINLAVFPNNSQRF